MYMPHTEKLSFFLGRLKFISFGCSPVQASFIHWDFSDKLCSAYRNFKAEAKLLKREKKNCTFSSVFKQYKNRLRVRDQLRCNPSHILMKMKCCLFPSPFYYKIYLKLRRSVAISLAILVTRCSLEPCG